MTVFIFSAHTMTKMIASLLEADWDNDARKWYVPNDVDRNLFKAVVA